MHWYRQTSYSMHTIPALQKMTAGQQLASFSFSLSLPLLRGRWWRAWTWSWTWTWNKLLVSSCTSMGFQMLMRLLPCKYKDRNSLTRICAQRDMTILQHASHQGTTNRRPNPTFAMRTLTFLSLCCWVFVRTVSRMLSCSLRWALFRVVGKLNNNSRPCRTSPFNAHCLPDPGIRHIFRKKRAWWWSAVPLHHSERSRCLPTWQLLTWAAFSSFSSFSYFVCLFGPHFALISVTNGFYTHQYSSHLQMFLAFLHWCQPQETVLMMVSCNTFFSALICHVHMTSL